MKHRIIGASGAIVLAATLAGCGQSSNAAGSVGEGFPEKDMTMLVGYGPGGSTDIGARLMADALEKELGIGVTVENKEGAGGQVGLTAVANAKCDGYTFGTTNFPSSIVSVLDESRGATYTKDSFDPIALQVIDPTAIVVAPDSPFKSVEELVDAANKSPGTIQYTTTGVASNEHFAMAAVEKASGAKFAPVHFPDGGGGPKTAFLGGEVDLYVGNVSDALEMPKNDQGRILGIMEAERSPFLPDVPTFTESGVDAEISSSRGFSYPECVPDDAVAVMSDAIGKIMEKDEFVKKMKDQGLAPDYRDSEEYSSYWGKTQKTFEELFPSVREEGK